MVKDGWSQSSSNEKKQEATSASHSLVTNSSKTTPVYDAMNPVYSQDAVTHPRPVGTTNVWGVYESKEKLIEMHFC